MGKVLRNGETVVQLLNERGSITLGEVMDALQVSESTARRLMARLAAEGRAVRSYGGLRRLQEYSYETLEKSHAAAKRRIGKAAVERSSSGDVLYLDSGTTTVCLAEALARTIAEGKLTDVKVVTNSFTNAQALAACCPVTLTGGDYRLKRRDVAGYTGEKTLGSFSFSKCFCGADAINGTFGLMTTDPDTARMVELAMSRSEQRYCLADNTKFGQTSFLSFCPDLRMLDGIVTDSGISPEILETYGAKVKIILA